MSKKTTTKAQPAKQGTELIEPFNVTRGSAYCDKYIVKGRKMRHKFATTSTEQIKRGVFRVTLTCKNCGGWTKAIEDYTVAGDIFSI